MNDCRLIVIMYNINRHNVSQMIKDQIKVSTPGVNIPVLPLASL